MNDFLKAITILAKYADDSYAPTHCEHDVMYVYAGIEAENVSKKDLKELDELGFFPEDEFGSGGFKSFRYGSC